jgi:hypothetical protein
LLLIKNREKEMKKLGMFWMVALAAVLSFTSCLKGSNNSTELHVGVISYTNDLKPVLKTIGGSFYGTELNAVVSKGELTYGDCCYFQVKVDWDLPENSAEMVRVTGYYVASIYVIAKADQYTAYPYLTDTSSVQVNEFPVVEMVSPDGPYGYAENFWMMTHKVKHEKGLMMHWDLSYNGSEVVTEENGQRYYNMFVRATASGTGGGTTASDEYYFNAYSANSFLERSAWEEKNKLGSNYTTGSTFTVRLNYVSDIKDGKITWKTTDLTLYIVMFVPE